jgi:alpha-glucosidase
VTDADGTPGQWYSHTFAPGQPDLDWESERVREDFDDILRFWLDRGNDGFPDRRGSGVSRDCRPAGRRVRR